MSLRAKGQPEASKLLKEIITTSPKRASQYRRSYKKLSRHQYNVIRKSAPETFPSYKIVQDAKKHCYPKDIKTTYTCVDVSLQPLLDHTTERLLLTVETVIEILQTAELNKLCLFTKWGFDGYSGHSSYKQAFQGHEATDSAVFITCIVPIRLVSGEKVI